MRPGLFLAWVWIVALTAAALFADVLPIKKYDESFVVNPLHRPPHWGIHEFLGSDQLGRSILSRVIYGGRVTLAVGVISTLLGMLAGGLLGLTAGYFGSKVDYVLTVFADALQAFPPIIFLLTLRSVLVNPDAPGRKGIGSLLLGSGKTFTIPVLVLMLAVLTIPNFYRQTRAQTIAFRHREFVTAAEASGARGWRIMFKELLPNVALPVASIGFIVMAGLMIAEGSLSLLGFGLPEPQPSWGKMIAEGKQNLQLGEHLHEMIVPLVTLFLTVFAFNIVGEQFRRRFDSRTEQR